MTSKYVSWGQLGQHNRGGNVTPFDAGVRSNRGGFDRGGFGGEQKPKAQFYVNVGYPVFLNITDPDTGKTVQEQRFVRLQLGIGLENITNAKAYGSDMTAAQLADAADQLRDKLIEAAASMEPGERRYGFNLEVELYRAKGEDHVANTVGRSNPMADGFQLFAQPEPEQPPVAAAG